MEIPRKVYIILQTQWNYSDEWFYEDGDTPVTAFVSREMAEARCREMERLQRIELMNTPPENEYSWWSNNIPATFGELENFTSLSPEDFEEKAQALNLPPFPDWQENDNFGKEFSNQEWWDNAWKTLSGDAIDAFWNLFDRLHFFEIAEVEVQS